MQGAKDLVDSERGVIAIGLILASTILVFTGKMSVQDWMTYTQVIGIGIIGSKTATGMLETWKGQSTTSSSSSSTPSPTVPEAKVVNDPPA